MHSAAPAHTFALALALFSTLSHALVVTLPTGTSVWDTTGATPNYIQWALYPLTFPPPASQFFDIYVRNGVGGMYEPFLNKSIALSVDASTALLFEVPASEAVKFVKGTGYQLFFSDPKDASIVYCQSEVFSIGTNTPSAGTELPGASTSPALPSTTTDMFATLSSIIASESSAAASSPVVDPASSSPLATIPAESSPVATGMSTVASPSATSPAAAQNEEDLSEASSPGGLWQQGGNLLFSSGNQLGFGRASVGAAVVAAGLLWLL